MSYAGTVIGKRIGLRLAGGLLAALVAASTLTYAQSAPANSVVPNIVNYSGTLSDSVGKALTHIAGVTFALYKDSEGGAALWMETQNIQPDNRGHFTAKLGSASAQGLPNDLFASGEARWLGVQVEGQAEQPRVLLLSVPYAMKAADAETLGGMPLSAFLMAKPPSASSSSLQSQGPRVAQGNGEQKATTKAVKTPTPFGTVNAIPLWVGTNPSTEIGVSSMTQNGSNIGVAGSLISNVLNANALVGVDKAAGFSAVGGINQDVADISYGTSGQSFSKLGIGVFGFLGTNSNTFETTVGREPFGVVGDAANVSGVVPVGVYGTADAGIAVAGESASSVQPTAFFANFDNTAGDLIFEALANKGECNIDTKGDLTCSGAITGVAQGQDNRMVRLYAVQSPDNWFEDFGSATLNNGSAVVHLDPAFAQTVNTNVEYHVFITPNGESEGLYVASKTAGGFEVREQHGGHSAIGFDYRIVGRRVGFENVRLEDVTRQQNQMAARRQMMKGHAANVLPPPAVAAQK